MSSRLGSNMFGGHSQRPAGFVGTCRGQCIKNISHRHNAAKNRNFIALEATRVAATTEFFMRRQHNGRPRLQHFGGTVLKNFITKPGTLLHNFKLWQGQSTRLQQNVIGNPYFANIM